MRTNLQLIKQTVTNCPKSRFVFKKDHLLAKLTENLIIVDDEITSLEARLRNTEEKLDISKSHTNTLIATLEKTEQQLHTITNKKNELKQYISKLQPYAKNLKKQKQYLEINLGDTLGHLDTTQQKLDDTLDEKQIITTKLNKANDQLKYAQQQLEQISTEKQYLGETLSNTQKQLKTSQEEQHNISAEKKAISFSLNKANDQLKHTQQQLEQVSTEKQYLGETLSNTQKQLKTSQEEQHNISAEKKAISFSLNKANDQLKHTQQQLEQVSTEKQCVSNTLSNTQEQLSCVTKTLDEAQHDVEKFKKNIRRLKDECEELEESLEDTEYELDKVKKDLSQEITKASSIEQKLHSQEASFHQQIKQHEQEINSLELRRQIVGKLVSTHNTCDKFKAFSDNLHNDFIEFTSHVSSLSEEAKVFLELQKIEQELKLISAFPAFHTKRTIAVGGGFSAGKSEFISSLFNDASIKLPSDIDATTAIPTYVLGCDDNDDIINNLIGVNIQGGTVNLSEINPNIHKELTHQFMKSFSFPLKNIMPYMFLPTPLAYDNLCFIDTPGYNPAASGESTTASDAETAKSYLSNAEALIWLIGADVNGTIPQTDIEFLKDIRKEDLTNKPLYIIYNKADLKSEKDIASVIDAITSTLEDKNIHFYGISAYSSVQKREYQFEKESLFEFIGELNKPSEKHNIIAQKIYTIDGMYQFAIKKELKETKMYAQSLYDIAYKLQIDNYAKGDNTVYDALDDIEGRFSKESQKLQEHLKHLDKAIKTLITQADDIFNCTSTVKRPIIDIKSIEINTIDSVEFEKHNENKENIEDEYRKYQMDEQFDDEESTVVLKKENTFSNLFGLFKQE